MEEAWEKHWEEVLEGLDDHERDDTTIYDVAKEAFKAGWMGCAAAVRKGQEV